MSKRRRKRKRHKAANSSPADVSSRPPATRSARRKVIWPWCLLALLVVAAISGVVLLRKPGVTPGPVAAGTTQGSDTSVGAADGSAKTIRDSTAVDSPSRWAIPNPDVGEMDINVRERVEGARAAVEHQPGSAEAWNTLGAVCDAHKLFRCAETCYRRAMALDPDDFRFPYLLAITLDSQGREADELIKLFDRAASLASDFAPVAFRLGEALVRQGRLQEAEQSFKHAVALDPNFAMAYRSLGQLLLSTGRTKQSVEQLERAVALQPQDSIVHASLAQAYSALGERDRADDAARQSQAYRAVVHAPDPVRAEILAMATGSPFLFTRAKDYYYQSMYAQALPDFLLVARALPNDPQVQVYIGSTYRRMNEPVPAETHLKKALDIDPNYVPALSEVGFLTMLQKRLDESLAYLRRADELEPNHPTINKRLGNVLVWQEKFDEAIRRFEISSHGRPASNKMHVNWGIALRETGDLTEAIDHLELAVQMNPTFAEAHHHLGIALQKAGQLEDAVDAYRRAVALDPNSDANDRLAEVTSLFEEP